jgi:hypothetical protein
MLLLVVVLLLWHNTTAASAVGICSSKTCSYVPALQEPRYFIVAVATPVASVSSL